jgi:WXG100 family type VII secretion target
MTSPGTGQFGGYDTVPDELHGVAQETRTDAQTISDALTALQSYCRSLDGPWMGPTEGQFQILMNDFQNNAAHLNEALINIAAELDQNAINYTTGEDANTKQVVQIAQSLPRMNF